MVLIFSAASTEGVCLLRLGDGGHVIHTFGKVHGFPAPYGSCKLDYVGADVELFETMLSIVQLSIVP